MLDAGSFVMIVRYRVYKFVIPNFQFVIFLSFGFRVSGCTDFDTGYWMLDATILRYRSVFYFCLFTFVLIFRVTQRFAEKQRYAEFFYLLYND